MERHYLLCSNSKTSTELTVKEEMEKMSGDEAFNFIQQKLEELRRLVEGTDKRIDKLERHDSPLGCHTRRRRP